MAQGWPWGRQIAIKKKPRKMVEHSQATANELFEFVRPFWGAGA